MKLVNYDELAKMPAGTVFRPYEPCILHEFHIKIEVPGCDLGVVCSTDIRKASLYAWLKDRDFVAKPYGGKVHVHPSNSDDCFMIINKQEVSGMIQILQDALNERKQTTALM